MILKLKKQIALFCFMIALFTSAVASAQHFVYLTWDNENGCQTFSNGPRKSFYSDITNEACIKNCEQSTVNYSVDGDTSNIASVTWSITGGTFTTSGLVCTVDWAGVGFGSVYATVTFNDGFVISHNFCVEKVGAPKAKFCVMPDLASQDVEGCIGQDIQFTNLSVAAAGSTIATYLWDFGDGLTSTVMNPIHSYSAVHNYVVTLTVTNECGCSTRFSMRAHIKKRGFNVLCPSVVCEGERGSYSLDQQLYARCNGIGWTALGGTVVAHTSGSVDVVWDQVDDFGFGYVSFDDTQCDVPCPTIETIRIPVVQAHGTIQGQQDICVKEQYRYTLPQWPTTEFNWTLADLSGSGATLITTDQRNEIIVNTYNPGQLILKCTYFNTLLHCGGTAQITLNVRTSPHFSGPTTACEGTSVVYSLFDQQGNPLSGDWTMDAPDGTTSYGTGTTFNADFPIAGVYIITAGDPAYCVTPPLTVYVGAKPVAPLLSDVTGPLEVCPGTPITYTIANAVSGTDFGWQIDPAEGTIQGTSFGDEVTVIFNGAGPYSLHVWRIMQQAPFCLSDILTIPVTKRSPALTITPEFPTSPLCGSTYMGYSVNYTEGDTYVWTVSPPTAGSISSGDGTTAVSVLWNQPDPATPSITANVIVTVIKCGEPFVKSKSVTIISTPQIAITTPNLTVCSGDPVSFSITPSGIGGTAVWEYGDGTSDSSGIHSYSASANATFNVTATVTNAGGCLVPAVAHLDINVIPAPAASVTPATTVSACEISTLSTHQLSVNIQGGLGSTSSIVWHYFDGSTDTALTSLPALTTSLYPSSYGFGYYYAVVTNIQGCHAETNHVTVLQYCPPVDCSLPPNAHITLSGVADSCTGFTVTAVPSPTPTSSHWTYYAGTGTVATNQLSVTNITSPGSYIILYTAVYGACELTERIDMVVPYHADLKYTITCGTTPGYYDVTLLDHSVHFPSTPVDHYVFSINGTPQYSGTSDSFHVGLPGLAAGATYTFGLEISGHNGAVQMPSCFDTRTVTLPAIPTAAFTIDNTVACAGEAIHLTAADTGPGLLYSWDFGDGSFNLLPNPEKVFAVGGLTYDITLTVTNEFGCSVTSATQHVEVKSTLLDGAIAPHNTTACEGIPVILTYQAFAGTPTPVLYQWMHDATVLAGATSSTYSVTQQGTYWVVVGDADGCTKNINLEAVTGTVTYIKPAKAHIAGPEGVCSGDTFTLSGLSNDPGVTYAWSVSPGGPMGVANAPAMMLMAGIPGSYTYTLTLSSPDGSGGYCTSTDTHTVVVYAAPVAPTVNFTVSCFNYTVTLNVTPAGPGNYTWSNGMNGATITVYDGGPYQVRYTNPAGCSVTTEVDVPKSPEDYLWIFPTGCYNICKGADSASIIGPAPEFHYWDWTENYTPDVTSTGNMPPYPITNTGTFQMTLDNGFCAVQSGEMNVTDFECHKCDKFNIALREAISSQVDANHQCYYKIVLIVSNAYGIPLYVDISSLAGLGVFSPSTILVPPGSGQLFTITMYPVGAFTGGPMTVSFEAALPDGQLCRTDLPFIFPPLCGQGGSARSYSELSIVPNPADGRTQLQYAFDGAGPLSGHRIEVYDLLGRMTYSMTPTAAEGMLDLSLLGYPAGYYIVLLKENGTILQQRKLIVK